MACPSRPAGREIQSLWTTIFPTIASLTPTRGVCIDMTSGQVRFDWAYVPFGEMPRAFAIFARRLHFRSGHHVDEPVRQMQVPRRPLQAI